MSKLPPEVLKARLDVALSLFEAGGLERFFAWIEADDLTGCAAELLLVEAILQAVSEGGELTGVIVLLADTFRDRLTEARDGLV